VSPGTIKASKVGGGPASGETEARELAPRQEVTYHCDRGCDFTRVYAEGITPPPAVDCRCGGTGRLPEAPEDAQPGTPGYTTNEKCGHQKDARTPFDRVRERRTEAELEQILAEELERVREGGWSR
jgi:hypothetical protein